MKRKRQNNYGPVLRMYVGCRHILEDLLHEVQMHGAKKCFFSFAVPAQPKRKVVQAASIASIEAGDDAPLCFVVNVQCQCRQRPWPRLEGEHESLVKLADKHPHNHRSQDSCPLCPVACRSDQWQPCRVGFVLQLPQ